MFGSGLTRPSKMEESPEASSMEVMDTGPTACPRGGGGVPVDVQGQKLGGQTGTPAAIWWDEWVGGVGKAGPGTEASMAQGWGRQEAGTVWDVGVGVGVGAGAVQSYR